MGSCKSFVIKPWFSVCKKISKGKTITPSMLRHSLINGTWRCEWMFADSSDNHYHEKNKSCPFKCLPSLSIIHNWRICIFFVLWWSVVMDLHFSNRWCFFTIDAYLQRWELGISDWKWQRVRFGIGCLWFIARWKGVKESFRSGVGD